MTDTEIEALRAGLNYIARRGYTGASFVARQVLDGTFDEREGAS